jgi:Xaa-Pro aminopeptidase
VAAAMAAAAAVREHGTLRAFRWAFYEEAVRRGHRPVFMVVDGVSVDHYDAPLREGQGMLIDCVSELHGYHGDYGRTVLIGEGSARLEATVAAVATAWEEVRQALRPGISFSQVRALGAETLRKLGHDITVPFVPHSVGLAHTDQPLTARYRPGPNADLVLVEDMILSVDCPVMDTGIGGTTHLEDLVHITPGGANPIHDTHQAVIRV